MFHKKNLQDLLYAYNCKTMVTWISYNRNGHLWQIVSIFYSNVKVNNYIINIHTHTNKICCYSLRMASQRFFQRSKTHVGI